MNELKIGNSIIGNGNPVYCIAEMSANHNQDFRYAVRLIIEAKYAGADAIKLQTYTPDTITINSRKEHFIASNKHSPWNGEYLYDLYEKAFTPWEWFPALQGVANGIGIDIFSSPFDSTAVDFLESMNVPAYKVASPEIVDVNLIRKIALTGKPVILSTGMATLAEIDEAVRTIRSTGNNQIALMKCTSSYPAEPDEMNLITIPHLARRTQLPVGLSDHSLGITAPIAAVALGATIVEKHIKLGWLTNIDGAFSLTPGEFRDMVTAIHFAEKAVGAVRYEPSDREETGIRRSLFAVEDVKKGELFTEQNVRSIRPGYGEHPRNLVNILGKVATVDIERGTPMSSDLYSTKFLFTQ